MHAFERFLTLLIANLAMPDKIEIKSSSNEARRNALQTQQLQGKTFREPRTVLEHSYDFDQFNLDRRKFLTEEAPPISKQTSM